MEVLKHGSKYKEPVPPKIYDIVCQRCGCEYRVREDELEEDYERSCSGYEWTGKFYAACPECGMNHLVYDRYAKAHES